MTRGGLRKEDLVLSRTGKIVSKKKSTSARENFLKYGFKKREETTEEAPPPKKRRRRRKVTAVHKANVLRVSDGCFSIGCAPSPAPIPRPSTKKNWWMLWRPT